MKKRLLMLIVAVELMAMPLALRAGDVASGPSAKENAPRVDSRDDRGRGAGQHKLSAEDEQKLLTFSKTYMPAAYNRLMKIKQSDPRRYQRMLATLWPRTKQLMAMPEDARQIHLEEAKLKMKIYHVANEYQSAGSPGDKEQIRNRLEALVGQQFDIEQKVREYRLKQLEEQLLRLKKELHSQNNERSKIIQDRLAWLIRPQSQTPNPANAKGRERDKREVIGQTD